jgi:hypothetical protein
MSILFPDSEGGWICAKHKKERGSERHGSNCYRCLEADNKRLRAAIEAALRISDLWILKEVETMFEDEARSLLAMKERFEEALAQ